MPTSEETAAKSKGKAVVTKCKQVVSSLRVMQILFWHVGGDNWPSLHAPHSRLDSNHYPVSRALLLTVDINFPAFFTFMGYKATLSFQVNKYFVCTPSEPSPTLGLQGQQV